MKLLVSASANGKINLRLKVTATNIEDATVQINFNVVNELAYQVVQADLTAEYILSLKIPTLPVVLQ